jgi:uncharacterized protein with PQ loop repeat
MDVVMWECIGVLGMLAIEASYLPQIHRLWAKKRADDVSFLFPGLNLLGRIMAFSFSIHVGQTILGFGFLAGIALRATFLVQVIYYQTGRDLLEKRIRAQRLRSVEKKAWIPSFINGGKAQ